MASERDTTTRGRRTLSTMVETPAAFVSLADVPLPLFEIPLAVVSLDADLPDEEGLGTAVPLPIGILL